MATERDLLDVPIRLRVARAEYERINALADRLAVRQIDLLRLAIAVGVDALERAIGGADAARIVAAIQEAGRAGAKF